LFTAIVAASGSPVRAEPAPRPAPTSQLVDGQRLHFALGQTGILALPGEIDLMFQHVDAIPIERVDDRGGTLAGDDAAYARLRLSPTLTLLDPGMAFFKVWRLAAELDVLRDWFLVGADREVLAADPRGRSDTGVIGQRLSQIYLSAGGEHMGFQLGLVRSRWGLGLVSNAGDDPRMQTSESPFGESFQGDHVVRVGVSAFPLGKGLSRPPLTASLAFDGVIDDDTARWSDGDRAYQFVAAVLGQTESLSLGIYTAFRSQAHFQGGVTEVAVLDATGRLRLANEDTLKVFIEAELATIRGRTSLPQSVVDEGSFSVDQNAALFRFSVETGPFIGVLEVGSASGDTNPFDDEQRGFTMDRDHRVGLLMFREAMLAGNAVSADNIADDDYRGEPPRGSERLATAGAVRGAMYANPRMSFRIVDELFAYAGFLFASADGQYVDAFWSGLAGGAPRGPRNGASATDLGWEVDAGVSWRFPVDWYQWRLRLEAAWYSPGAVFNDEAGRAAPDVGGVWLHAGLLW